MPALRRLRGTPKKYDPVDRGAAKSSTGRPKGGPKGGPKKSEKNEEKSKEKSKDLSAYGFEHAAGDASQAGGPTSESKADEAGSTSVASDASSTSQFTPQLSPAPAPPRQTNPSRTLKKSVGPGERDVHFLNNEEWQRHHESKLGTKTRKLTFGRGFTLAE